MSDPLLPHALDFAASLAAAAGASLHCAGMCGGFAAAASIDAAPGREAVRSPRALRVVPGKRAILAQALYHAGKTSSYLFLGAMAAAAGAAVNAAGTAPAMALSAAAGLILITAGALSLRPRAASQARPGGRRARLLGAWSRWGASLVALRSPLRPLYLGVFSGLLPCPLVYAFLARAAASPSVLDALLVMAALGLGTAPILVAAAMAGALVPPLARARLSAVSGALLVALGLWTLWRGWAPPPCCAG
jgi:sulfite exporter TauE/SafE